MPETSSALSTRSKDGTPDRKSAWSLYMAAVGEWTIVGIMGRLVMPIMTTGFGIGPELLGWAMTLPRMLDAILDPLIGYISDRTKSRWGRRRPYVFIGATLSGLMAMAIWWVSPAWSNPVQFTYLLVTGMLFWIGFALFSISTYAMCYELADDYEYRVKFFAIRSLCAQLAGLVIGGWAYWVVLRPVFGGEVPGIRWVSIGLAVIIVVGGWIPAFFFKERFAASAQPAVTHSLLRAMREAWQSRPLRQLIIIRLLLGFGFAIFNGLYFYVNAYYACGGDKVLATKIAGISDMVIVGLNLLQVPLIGPLAKRLDRRTLLLMGVGAHLGLAAFSALVFTPSMPYLQLAATLFWAPAGFIFGTVCASAIPDICDVDELEHGTRREGLFGAALVFLNKLEVALCTLVPGYVLVLSGFTATTAMQTEKTLMWLRACSYVPYVLAAVIALVVAMRYPLTAEVMKKVRDELTVRRAAKSTP